VCRAHTLYADRLACAGELRVPGFILIAHGNNSQVVYRPGDGCSTCARVGTRDETNTGTRDQTRVCHGPDDRGVFCALAVGAGGHAASDIRGMVRCAQFAQFKVAGKVY